MQSEAEPAAPAESPEPVAVEKEEEEANVEAAPPAAAPAEPSESEPAGDEPAEAEQVVAPTQVCVFSSCSWLHHHPLNLYWLEKRLPFHLASSYHLKTSSLPLNSYRSIQIYDRFCTL